MKSKMENEEWKDIKDYEGLYQVSNLGRIKSLPRNRKFRHGYYKTTEKLLKQTKLKSGYKQARLYKENGEYKQFNVHRIVAEAFIPNPDNLTQINHKDENKSNNAIDNLEWCSQEYNLKYGTCMERSQMTRALNRKYKHVLQIDKYTGEIIKEWNSVKETEILGGFSYSGVLECCNGKLKTSCKYKWRYV